MNRLIQYGYSFRFFLLLLASGLFVRLLLEALLQLSDQLFIYPDSFSYYDAATDLYIHFRGHCYRPVGIAFLAGIPYLFGAKGTFIFGWSIYLNVVCWLGTALLIFALLRNYLAPKWAFWVAMLYLLCVGPATIAFHLLTENIFSFLMAGFLYLYYCYQNTQRYAYLAAAIAVLLFSMLVKPGTTYLAVVVVAICWKIIYQHRKNRSSWLIYGTFALLVIQLVGMKAQFGNATLSYIDGITYHNYLCTKAVCYQEQLPYHQLNNERAAYLHQFSLPERKAIAAADLKHQLTHNTLNLLKAYGSNLIDNTISGSPYIQDCENRNQTAWFTKSKFVLFFVSKWQNRFFTCIGLLLALATILRHKQTGKTALMASFVLWYIVLLSGVSCSQGDRFHLVIYPISILLIGLWLSRFNIKKKRLIKRFSVLLRIFFGLHILMFLTGISSTKHNHVWP